MCSPNTFGKQQSVRYLAKLGRLFLPIYHLGFLQLLLQLMHLEWATWLVQSVYRFAASVHYAEHASRLLPWLRLAEVVTRRLQTLVVVT